MSRFLAVLFLRHSFWRQSWRHRLGQVATGIAYAYLAAMLVLLVFEERFLFPGATFGRPFREPPEDLRVRELFLPLEFGTIHAWFLAPVGWEPTHGAVLHSHGNGGNLSVLADRARNWRDHLGRAVLIYDYPGFGKSTGWPSEARCVATGEVLFRWLTAEAKVPPAEVVLVGESMGGAIATELAARHAVRLLVLHGAFTSFPDMAQRRFPIFPGRYLVRSRMDNEQRIAEVRCPVLIGHGTADDVVPFGDGKRISARAPQPSRFLSINGGKHAPPNDAAYFAAVQAFLAETAKSR